MANFELVNRHNSISQITTDVSAAHTITNNTAEFIVAGVLVEVHTGRGRFPIIHIDDATAVEIAPGESATIDPTGVTGAIGVGFIGAKASVDSTADFTISRSVATPRKSGKKG